MIRREGWKHENKKRGYANWRIEQRIHVTNKANNKSKKKKKRKKKQILTWPGCRFHVLYPFRNSIDNCRFQSLAPAKTASSYLLIFFSAQIPICQSDMLYKREGCYFFFFFFVLVGNVPAHIYFNSAYLLASVTVVAATAAVWQHENTTFPIGFVVNCSRFFVIRVHTQPHTLTHMVKYSNRREERPHENKRWTMAKCKMYCKVGWKIEMAQMLQ